MLAGAQFLAVLPWHLWRKVNPEQARRMVRRQMTGRGERFLDRLRVDIFQRPGGVYWRLLKHAGCEYGDLERLVTTDGVEAVLQKLLRAGVYLTADEFKGRTPIRRGASLRIESTPGQLRSPRAAHHIRASSGGSRSTGTPVLIDLRFVRACAAACLICLDNFGGREWVRADWESPGAGARFRLTKFGMFGSTPQAWFAQIDPSSAALAPGIRWSSLAIQWVSWLAGRPLPAPVTCTLQDPEPVVRWLEHVLRSGRVPVVFTFSGSAVRACEAAAGLGVDLAGTRFLLAGEPITAARAGRLKQAGCEAIPRYGSMECGAIGYGCRHGWHPDDVHLLEHAHALVQAGDMASGLGVVPQALFVTNLNRHSPFLMLNVSLGDQAEITRRSCGCEWELLGMTTHLHSIRSFEKLTCGGVTFHAGDVIPLLEQVLPERFGGSSIDYQLVEEESETGKPVMTLRVHPRLGLLAEEQVRETFLDRLAHASVVYSAMVEIWRDAGTLRVVRQAPAVSRAGKILHLHVDRKT